MTEQNQNPASTDDVEGHVRRSEPDRMEGWGTGLPDDVEGHGRYWPSNDSDQIDGEGTDQPDDDAEGHSFRGA
jgi:hypothetical protein